MGKHHNLYYLLLEDQQQNLIDIQAKERIKKNIENFYKEIKPPWNVIPPNAFEGSGLVSITIPESVKSISSNTFDGCDSLKSVKLHDSLTKIGDYAFANCTALTEFTIPDSVTTIGIFAFEGCTALREITIPSTVTTFERWIFTDCTGLTSATFADGCLQVPEGMFSECTNLTTVSLPDTLEKIESNAFRNCSSLKDLELPTGLKTIAYQAFKNCDSLTEVVIPAVPVIGKHAFAECDKLSKITISAGTLTIDEYAFDECESLEWVTIPKSVTKMGFGAFYSCDNLDGVIFKGDAPTVDRPFASTVTRCYYPAGNKTWSSMDASKLGNDVFLLESGTNLTGTFGTRLTWTLTKDNVLTISGKGGMPEFSNYSSNTAPWYSARKFVDSLVVSSGINTINNYAFYDCYNLKTVSVADSVRKINAYAFAYCDVLETINIPAKVVEIGQNAFYKCFKMKNVTLPSGLTTIGKEAFCNCDSITSVKIPDSVTSLGNYAFYSCDKLKTVTVSGSVVKIPTEAFRDCKKLTTVTLSKGITEIADSAFRDCVKLSSLSLPSTLEKIGASAFRGCESLKSLTVPSKVTSIGTSAFMNCFSLKEIKLPETVKTISNYTFECCDSLEEITIPASVTSVGYEAFKDCSVLESIIFSGDAPKIYNDTFTNVYATAYYPLGNATWTADQFKDYGGLLEWEGYLSTPKLKAISNASGGVKLTWNKVGGAAKYQVLVKTSKTGTWQKVYTTANTSYTYSKAESGKTYYMTVKAVDSTGKIISDYNTTGLNIKFLSQPELSKISKTSTGVKLTWSKVSGASKYQVLAKTSKSGEWKKVYTTSNTSYTYTKAQSGKYCYMTVKAVASDGSTVSAYNTTGLNVKFLSQPAVSKLSNTSKGVKVTWNKVTGAEKYQVYVKTSKDGTWKSIGTTTNTSCTYTKAQSGKTYYFTVKALADDGKTASTYNSTGTKLLFLGEPDITNLKSTSKGISVSWEASKGAGKYKVYVKTSKDGDWSCVATVSKTSYTYTKAKSGKTYYFSVRAVDSDGKIMSSYDTAGMKIKFAK